MDSQLLLYGTLGLMGAAVLLLLFTSIIMSLRERKLRKILRENTDQDFIAAVRDLVCKGPWSRLKTYVAVRRYKQVFPEGVLKGATSLSELKLLGKSDPVSIIRIEYVYHAFYTTAAESTSISLLSIVITTSMLLAASFASIMKLAYRYHGDLDANALGNTIVIIITISLIYVVCSLWVYYLYRKRRRNSELLRKIQERLNHIGS